MSKNLGEKDKELMEKVLGWLVPAIKGQKQMMKGAGYDPSWENFSGTFGWHQIRARLKDPDLERIYKELWEQVK